MLPTDVLQRLRDGNAIVVQDNARVLPLSASASCCSHQNKADGQLDYLYLTSNSRYMRMMRRETTDSQSTCPLPYLNSIQGHNKLSRWDSTPSMSIRSLQRNARNKCTISPPRVPSRSMAFSTEIMAPQGAGLSLPVRRESVEDTADQISKILDELDMIGDDKPEAIKPDDETVTTASTSTTSETKDSEMKFSLERLLNDI